MEKEILFISYRFPPQNPGGVVRGVKFIKYLAKFGWKVHVFVPQGSTKQGYEKDLSHPNIHIQEVYCPKPYEKVYSIFSSIRKIISPKFQSQNNSSASIKYNAQVLKRSFLFRTLWLLHFPDEAVYWGRHLYSAGMKFFKKHPSCEIVFCHGPPFSPFKTAIRFKKFGKKVVLDFRDPWKEDPHFEYPFSYLKKSIQELETQILKEASSVTTVTESLKENFSSKVMDNPGKFYSITNGFDPDDFESHRVESSPDRFRIIHAGSLFLRDTTPFLEGLKLFLEKNLQAKEFVDCQFWGPFDLTLDLEIRRFGLENTCKQNGVIAHDRLIQEQFKAAVFLMILQEEGIYNSAIPGKIFEYAAARRPILGFGPSGEAQRLIEKNGWGKYFTGKVSSTEISNKIEEYFDLWKKRKLIPFENEETLQPFSRERLTRELEDVLLKP